MNKIIATLLMAAICISTFSLTACEKQSEIPKVYEFQNLKWGSSVEECLEVLGVTEDEVTIEPISEELPYYKVRNLTYDTKIYEKDATLQLVFYDDCLDTGISLGLVRIYYAFKETVSTQEWISLINEDIISQGFETKDPAFPSEEFLVMDINEKSLADLEDPPIKERSLEIWQQVFPKKAEDEFFSEETVLKAQILVDINRFPKSTITEKTQEQLPTTVIIDGTNAAIVQYAVDNP